MSQHIATTLDDLSDVIVEATIPRPDGKMITVRLKTLSGEQVWEVRRAIKWPKPPVKDYRKTGGEVLPIYDYEDATYVAAQEDASRELGYRHLLLSLQIDIPGETFEEKLEALRTRLGQWALNSLLSVSNRLHYPNPEEVNAIALSFQPAGDGSLPGSE